MPTFHRYRTGNTARTANRYRGPAELLLTSCPLEDAVHAFADAGAQRVLKPLIRPTPPTDPSPSALRRISFHEITREAILKAVQQPQAIDRHLVEAQQARRILDRLISYPVSQVLGRSIRRGLSAGRVQSVAVRLSSSSLKRT